MNIGKIRKSVATERDMELINGYSRRTLTPDDVYIFNVVLCDNDIDRDGERFSEEALATLAALFVGRTGIFDHESSAKNQAARIFHTQVVRRNGKQNALGQPYLFVEARAYMLKTEKNASLIEDIDGGIKKEVSISCSMKRKTCSICGAQRGSCTHRAGEIYDSKRCYFELSGPTDAYEWSFVAVPAQKNAGVVKKLEAQEETLKKIRSGEFAMSEEDYRKSQEMVRKLEELGTYAEQHRNMLEKDVIAELTIRFPDLPQHIIKYMVKSLDTEQVRQTKEYFDKKAAPAQLKTRRTSSDNGKFKI